MRDVPLTAARQQNAEIGGAPALASRLREIAADSNIDHAALSLVSAGLFELLGLVPEDAAIAADVALYAQLSGLESHGLVHLPLSVTGLIDGTIRVRPQLHIHRDGTATAHVDGDCGLGLVVSRKAMDLAIAIAAEHGVGAVAVRNSSHFGAAGYYGDLAAHHGMIGIAMSNAAPAIAPTGGVTALLGTNPIGVGVPLGAGEPMVLDMATSMVARSRIRQSLAAGEASIPEGWALDAAGNPTTDAAVAIAGSVMPIGGPKGYGLAALVEFLCSALSDGEPGFAITYENVVKRPSGIGHFFLALNPASFCGSDAFRRRADHIATVIETSKGRAGAGAPRLPGRRAQDARRASMTAGIPMGPNLKTALLQTAELLEKRTADIAGRATHAVETRQ
jgi:LDH2 family malate/lactate/ureidoglycolate dehydrogenase